MPKLNKEFFEGSEVLFVGYSGKNQGFSKMVYKTFVKNGIKVYPVNNKAGGNYDVQVYKCMEDLPKIPRTAYILLNKENARKAVKELIDKGVKKILFQNSKNTDQKILDECAKRGVQTVVSCPMMSFGTGIHRLHGFLKGVRK